MNVGLFGARADDRGLGRLTSDFWRHMTPDRTLVVDMGPHARGFTQHFGRYPDAVVTPFGGGILDEQVMCRFFAGLDVAVMFETAYDHRAYDLARRAGCRTVLYTMPEFHRHLTEHLPHPDVLWVPTCWRLDTLPAATRLVPAPVATDRAPPPDGPGKALRVVHVAGRRAMADRNGTVALLRALRLLHRDVTVRVTTQDPRLPNVSLRDLPVTVETGGVADHWDLYRHADVLVMPRRYGGLCLPTQEAMAAGLAVVMTDCEPNPQTWPVVPVRTRRAETIRTPAGPVRLHDADPTDLAATIDRLAAHPDELDERKTQARQWADTHSWDILAPVWRTELEQAATPTTVAA